MKLIIGQQDWTLPDQLAFELVESCLLLTELNIGDRKKTLAAIRGLKQDILNGIETNAGEQYSVTLKKRYRD